MLHPKANIQVLLLVISLLTAVQAIEANCEVLRSEVLLATLPNQRQLYDLSDLFRGYSLSYELQTDSIDTFDLYPPFRLVNSSDIEDPVLENNKRLTMDILTDSNLAWREQGSSLVQRNATRVSVQFGQLNKFMHLTFSASLDIDLDEGVKCFDVSSLEKNITLVDCQVVREGQPIDIHYIANLTSGQSTKYEHDYFEDAIQCSRRKTLLYMTNDMPYLLSATLLDIDQLDNKSNTPVPTYLAVYQLDQNNSWKPKLIQIINETALNLTRRLTITDLTVDAQNYVYLIDMKAVVMRFRYTPSRRLIYDMSSYAEEVGVSWHKIAAIHDFRGRTTIMVASSDSIIQLDWSRGEESASEVHSVQRYQMVQNLSKIQDLQVNRQVMVLQADDHFYFYRRDLLRLKYLLCVNETYGSLCMLDQVTPNAVLVGNSQSLSYTVSIGYLSISDTRQNSSLTVVATSLNVSCQVQMTIVAISDASQIIQVKELLNYSYETPVQLNLPLHAYFMGSRLAYRVESAPQVNTTIRHIESVRISLPDDIRMDYSLVDTFILNNSAYYRVSSKDNFIHIDVCTASVLEYNVYECDILRELEFESEVILISLYPMLEFQDERVETIALLGCVLNNTPNVLRFREIRSGDAYPDLIINETTLVTDVAINSQFILATSTELKTVFVYRITLSQQYALMIKITYGTIKEQLEELTTFEPLECILAPWDPNLLFIRNIDCILILKVTTGGVTVLSSIPIEQEYIEHEWAIVVNNVFNLLLVQEYRGELLEYSLVNLYSPFLLRTISLMNANVSAPLHLDTSSNSMFVSIKTNYELEDEIHYGISMIKLGTPAINSFYAYIDMPTSHFTMASIELNDSIMIEILDRQYNHSKRIFFEPTLSLSSSISSNISQKSFPTRLTIFCATMSQIYDFVLRLYNFQLPLAATYGDNVQLSMNVSENGSIATYVLKQTELKRQLFKGSVGQYSIECGQRVTGCQIQGHIRPFRQLFSRERITQYMPFGNGTLLWTLDIMGYISIYRINIEEPIAIVGEPQIDPKTACLNWVFFSDNANDYVLVHCRNSTSQYFMWHIIENTFPQFKKVVMISDKDWVGNPSKMEVVKNRLFILDSTAYGPANGTIQVLRINTVLLIIEWERIIDATDFALSGVQSRLNDFDILPTWSWSSSWLILLVTVDNTGIAYGFFDPYDQSSLRLYPRGSISLMEDPSIEPFELDDSKFLQIELLNMNDTISLMKYDVILTVSHGRHLQLHLQFDASSKIFCSLTTTYRKYGNLVPHNWARGVAGGVDYTGSPIDHSYLLISYRNQQQDGQQPTDILALHKIGVNEDGSQNEVIATIRVARQNSTSTAFIWQQYPSKKIYLAVTEDNSTIGLYTLHAGTEISFVYEATTKPPISYNLSTDLKVTARNQLNNVTATLNIDLAVIFPIPPDQLKWYIMLAMIAVTVAIMAAIIFYFRYRKRNRSRKSLMDSSDRSSATEFV